MTNNTSFPPIARSDALILILGSMPGQKSLNEKQYYAHSRNSFWPIICKLLDADYDLDYQERRTLLLDNKIALWDVLKSCYRRGSLDAAIEQATAVPNDFTRFFLTHTEIRMVFFNGTIAAQLFGRHVLKRLEKGHQERHYQKLPSTSPAHAMMTMEQKLKQWKMILNYL